jgi:Putative phage serine protease XkdF
MCLSCGCGCNDPDNDHDGAPGAITMAVLKQAADAAGTDIPGVVANIVRTLAGGKTAAKALTTDMAAVNVFKAQDEQRYTLGVAYPAMKADVAVAADGHIDFVSPEVLEKTAWAWMTEHRNIGLFHKAGTEGHATVVESYIYRGPDWHNEIAGETHVIKAGDWMLGTVWDEYGWQLVKAGLVNGWSPQGGARRINPSADRLAQLRS